MSDTGKSQGKLIAVALVGILGLLSYQAFASKMNDGCRARAASVSGKGLVTVLDTKWGLGGCQFLTQWKHNSEAAWESEQTFRIFET